MRVVKAWPTCPLTYSSVYSSAMFMYPSRQASTPLGRVRGRRRRRRRRTPPPRAVCGRRHSTCRGIAVASGFLSACVHHIASVNSALFACTTVPMHSSVLVCTTVLACTRVPAYTMLVCTTVHGYTAVLVCITVPPCTTVPVCTTMPVCLCACVHSARVHWCATTPAEY